MNGDVDDASGFVDQERARPDDVALFRVRCGAHVNRGNSRGMFLGSNMIARRAASLSRWYRASRNLSLHWRNTLMNREESFRFALRNARCIAAMRHRVESVPPTKKFPLTLLTRL